MPNERSIDVDTYLYFKIAEILVRDIWRSEMNKKLYIVYCIDTEGHLHEPIKATFERLKEIFNIDIKPTKENLRKFQNKEVYLGGLENEVAKVVTHIFYPITILGIK